jgi:hypothetical protein
MPYPKFDRSRLTLQPLDARTHDVSVDDLARLDDPLPAFHHPALPILAKRMITAQKRGAAVILMMGAHVIKAGLGRYVIALMERGLISAIALNGAGSIHDYELALVGGTSESVARYIRTGEFGLWRETGALNEMAVQAAKEGIGYGEAVGRAIWEGDLPHRDISVLAAGYRLGIPITLHVGIGYDIVHEHPNCDGAALGAASYTDMLIYAHQVSRLEGGVMLCFGSSVMGPEVYLKSLSMARNVAQSEGKAIAHFTTAVFDLLDLGEDLTQEPDKSEPAYYFRPYKTILVRTVRDGGESFYVRGDHRDTLPALYGCIRKALAEA